MQIRCEYCDFVCICYDDWIEHLASNPHQRIIKDCINQWEPDLNDRSFVVLLNGELQPTNQNICWHFATYGLVSNAYFDNNLEFCVIQLDKKKYAVKAVADKHNLEYTTLFCRLKSDISSDEWESLTTSASKNLKIQHLKLMTSLKFLPDIDSQLNYLMRQITMKSEKIALRQQLITKLAHLLRSDFPRCVLCPYGEDATGLESVQTFILHLHFDAYGKSQYNTPVPYKLEYQSKSEIFADFEKALWSKGLFYQDFNSHPNDPVPLITFNSSDGIECEFTFESLLPVQLSKLIRFILKLDPRLPLLFRFVDYWGHYHKLIGPYCNLIPNYCLHLLLIVFLTRRRIIPSISVIQSMREHVIEINGWDASFSTDVEKIGNLISCIHPQPFKTDPVTGKPTAHSILELISDFFKLYAHTELISQVICPLTGELLPKSIFQPGNESQLPNSLDAYKYWARDQPPEQRFNINSPLCVQHPFDLSCNVSATTEENVLFNFQFLCADTLEIVQNILSHREEVSLTDIFKPVPPIGNTNPEQKNVEKNIIPQKMQNLKRSLDYETPTTRKELRKFTDYAYDETNEKLRLPYEQSDQFSDFSDNDNYCEDPYDNDRKRIRQEEFNVTHERLCAKSERTYTKQMPARKFTDYAYDEMKEKERRHYEQSDQFSDFSDNDSYFENLNDNDRNRVRQEKFNGAHERLSEKSNHAYTKELPARSSTNQPESFSTEQSREEPRDNAWTRIHQEFSASHERLSEKSSRTYSEEKPACSSTKQPQSFSIERSTEMMSHSNRALPVEMYLKTLFVKCILPKKGTKRIRVLLDDSVERSYIRKNAAEELGLSEVGQVEVVHLGGKSGTERNVQQHCVYNIMLMKTKVKKKITVMKFEVLDQEQICGEVPRLTAGPWLEEFTKNKIWLHDVAREGPAPIEIDLVIGSDLYGEILTGKTMHMNSGLTAVETIFGWSASGEMQIKKKKIRRGSVARTHELPTRPRQFSRKRNVVDKNYSGAKKRQH